MTYDVDSGGMLVQFHSIAPTSTVLTGETPTGADVMQNVTADQYSSDPENVFVPPVIAVPEETSAVCSDTDSSDDPVMNCCVHVAPVAPVSEPMVGKFSAIPIEHTAS